MAKSVYRFNLDLHARHSQISLPVQLGDTARRLEMTLSERGKVFKIPSGCRVVLFGKKPNDETILHDCVIIDNLVVQYQFNDATATTEGLTQCQLRVYGVDDFILGTPQFDLVVDGRVLYNDDIDYEDERYTALDNIFLAETDRVNAEAARESAEEARRENESERIGNEEVREENESAREQAEALRVAAENARAEAEEDRQNYITDLEQRVADGEFNGADGRDGTNGEDGAPGADGADGVDGEDGEDGFSPTITATQDGEDTILTITDIDGTRTVRIPKTQGISPTIETSKSGKVTTVTVTDVEGVKTFTINDGADGADGKDGENGANGADGADGEDGFSPIVSVSKSGTTTTITITDANGVKTATIRDGTNGTNGTNGADGADGEDGYTPVKGVDYFTEADKTEMVNAVLAALPHYDGTVDDG